MVFVIYTNIPKHFRDQCENRMRPVEETTEIIPFPVSNNCLENASAISRFVTELVYLSIT